LTLALSYFLLCSCGTPVIQLGIDPSQLADGAYVDLLKQAEALRQE
jgi:hypothetical protein